MNTLAVEAYTCTVCAYRFDAKEQPTICPNCRTAGGNRTIPSRKTLTIASQNDSFRTGMVVGGCPLPGTVVVTSGVSGRGRDFQTAAYLAAAFDKTFTEENDPWGDHSFGVVTVKGERLYWKIDYYDAAQEYGSDDPADPARTYRVLTILFPSEY